jgi:hypothetical protein
MLHAFPAKTRTSRKVRSSVTLDFLKIRNCKGLELPLLGFDIATSELSKRLSINQNLSPSGLKHEPPSSNILATENENIAELETVF